MPVWERDGAAKHHTIATRLGPYAPCIAKGPVCLIKFWGCRHAPHVIMKKEQLCISVPLPNIDSTLFISKIIIASTQHNNEK